MNSTTSMQSGKYSRMRPIDIWVLLPCAIWWRLPMIESIAFRLRLLSSSRNSLRPSAHIELKFSAVSTNRPAFGLGMLSSLVIANFATCGLAARFTNSPYVSLRAFSRNPAVSTHRYLPQWPMSSMSPPVATSVRFNNDFSESSCLVSSRLRILQGCEAIDSFFHACFHGMFIRRSGRYGLHVAGIIQQISVSRFNRLRLRRMPR